MNYCREVHLFEKEYLSVKNQVNQLSPDQNQVLLLQAVIIQALQKFLDHLPNSSIEDSGKPCHIDSLHSIPSKEMCPALGSSRVTASHLITSLDYIRKVNQFLQSAQTWCHFNELGPPHCKQATSIPWRALWNLSNFYAPSPPISEIEKVTKGFVCQSPLNVSCICVSQTLSIYTAPNSLKAYYKAFSLLVLRTHRKGVIIGMKKHTQGSYLAREQREVVQEL